MNLATQDFLATFSKTPHFDPATPETHLVIAETGCDRDIVGVIRAITVKVSQCLNPLVIARS